MVWAFVVEPFVPASGAPVTEKVARSVVRPAPNEAKAWVGALMKSLWSVMLPFAWVLVRARLNLDIRSFGGGGGRYQQTGQGEVRGGAARAGGGVDDNSTGGSDCPTEE